MLHPRMREWAYPVNRVEVPDNCPSLLWPEADGKKVTYKVMLATDSLFKNNLTESSNQRWAVYPVHQPLKPGRWFWKYAYKSGSEGQWNWSPVYDFVVGAKSKKAVVTPGVAEVLQRNNQPHPRLWGLRTGAAAFYANNKSNPEALDVIASAQKLLGQPLPEENPTRPRDTTGMTALQRKQMVEFMYHGFGDKVAEPVKKLCLAYLLTKDKRFISEAIKRGVHMANMSPDGLATRDDFNNGNVLEGIAWVYDIGYDQLSAAEKEALRTAMLTRGQRIYKNLPNRFELQMCDNHIWQHILRNFSIAAVAAANDVPQANEWLAYVYEVWSARFPVLGTTDGGWHEGNGYFRVHFETLIYLPLLFSEISGQDYFNLPWMQNLPYYMLYSYPPQSASTEFGDMHENLSDMVKTQALFADALSRKVNNPYLNGYVSELKKHYPRFFKGNDDFLLFRLLTYKDKQAVVVKSPETLPRSREFKDVGLVAMHSNLANQAKDMAVYLNANPFGAAGHGHAAQNAITVNYKGAKIFGGTGYYSNFSDAHNLLDYRSSRGYCTILADSLGQRIGEDGYGWIPRAITGKRIQYALGDASNAYGNVTTDFWLSRFKEINVAPDEKNGYGNPEVKLYRRHVLQLDDNYILLYDELEAAKPVKWTSQFHSPFSIKSREESDAAAFSVSTPAGNAFTEVFASVPAGKVIHQKYNYPAKNWKGKTDDEGNIIEFKDQWHVGITTSAPVKANRFLTLIHVGGAAAEPVKVLDKKDGNYRLKAGNWTINAELNTGKAASLTVTATDGNAAFSYGAAPVTVKGKQYTHAVNGSSMLVEDVKQEVVDQYPAVVKYDIGFQNK
ncbi:DUF4962 domain-containing protein (plasmid) [Pedobacter sp. BS3]|nr:DUF4962 domain-containing protein [Pedobacter sp. BS3]